MHIFKFYNFVNENHSHLVNKPFKIDKFVKVNIKPCSAHHCTFWKQVLYHWPPYQNATQPILSTHFLTV